MKQQTCLILFSLVYLCTLCATTQAQTVPVISEAQAQSADFDAPWWKDAIQITDFQVCNSLSATPTAAAEQTIVQLTRSDTALFIRFIAMDSKIDQRDQSALDEFADKFPAGDHAEVWLPNYGIVVLAFDSAGNRHDSRNFDSDYSSGMKLKTRVFKDRWEAIVVIPLKTIFPRDLGKNLPINFVRHIDHDKSTDSQVHERSTPAGKRETDFIRFPLE